jgi:hypothetical protein
LALGGVFEAILIGRVTVRFPPFIDIIYTWVCYRSLLSLKPSLAAETLDQRMEASFNRTNVAKEELFHFVRKTILALVDKEQRQFQTCSSLKEFCRVDVGVIRTEDGRLEYFVNEVERGINVCLWVGTWKPERAGQIAKKLTMPLHRWISEKKAASKHLY